MGHREELRGHLWISMILALAAGALLIASGCPEPDPDDRGDDDAGDDDAGDDDAGDDDAGDDDAGDDDAGDDDTAPPPEIELCGQLDGEAPPIVPSGSLGAAEGQDAQYCGSGFPGLNLAANDPFAGDRGVEPPPYLSSPFEACIDALEESIASRPLCQQGQGATLLVSQQGQSDPRWQEGSFDDLFDTIQDAIDAADHCDTIVVRPGVYREYLVIEDKDVRLFSDTWNEAGTEEDGDELVTDYEAERIDLLHYYETGERVVTETRQPYRKPRKRAVRTVLEGGGYAEGPELGGLIEIDHDDPSDPNRGCGNRRPMVDFKAGTTRNTVFDGFTVRLMPEQDHTIPGHGHTLQCRGGSPIIRHNVIYNNGSTGIGVHASFVDTTPLTPPCQYDPSLEQETFRNEDYRHTNVEVRPVPLIYDNISFQNNGLGLGNNHYSCAVMIDNEALWNAVPEALADHQSPGIGTRHGAKTCLDLNIVYENAWTGIATHQGYLQPADDCAVDPVACNHIDERTQAVITRNVVFDNGFPEAPENSRGGIAVDGVGLPGEPVRIRENVVFSTRISGIGVRNEYAGEAHGFVMDDSYVEIANNTVFSNDSVGISCAGSDRGTAHCTVVGNDVFWNHEVGIGFMDDAAGSALHNVSACNTSAGFQTQEAVEPAGIAILDNIAFANVLAGTMTPGSPHDFNLLSANAGQAATCDAPPQGNMCINPQVGSQNGGTVGADDLFVDPVFIDAAGFDYTLDGGSPAVDSGTDVSSYYGGWPVAGAGPDRGSHEQ